MFTISHIGICTCNIEAIIIDVVNENQIWEKNAYDVFPFVRKNYRIQQRNKETQWFIALWENDSIKQSKYWYCC